MTDNFEVTNASGMLLFEQALMFHQSKTLDLDNSVNLLSEGMPFLLEVVNNNQVLIDVLAKKFKCGEQLIRIATIEYLKVAYFQHLDNPYRVLGLSPWSTPEEAKKRYRFLIRLFHPDRGLVNYTSDIDAAANINHAYSKISDKVSKGLTKSYYSPTDVSNQNSEKFNHSSFNFNKVFLKLISTGQQIARWFSKIDFRAHFKKNKVYLNRFFSIAGTLISLIWNALKLLLISIKKLLEFAVDSFKWFAIILKLIFVAFFNFLLRTSSLVNKFKNVEIKTWHSNVVILTSVLIVFYSLDGLQASQNVIAQINYYFEEQAEANKQLALRQEKVRKEAERVAQEKTEAAKRLAMREEELRKEEQARINEASQANVRISLPTKQPLNKQTIPRSSQKDDRQSKESGMILTRVLIDENEDDAQNEKTQLDAKID